MKCTLPKDALLSSLQMAERLVGKKESLPVLSCVLLEADSSLVLRATNLEAGVQVSMIANVDEKGTAALPAGVLLQTIRSLRENAITLSHEGENIIVETPSSKTLIKAISAEEFPRIDPKLNESISIHREKCITALRSVSYAASPSMIRPELGSVLVRISENSITCVATDSFRLAEKIVNGSGAKSEFEALIPLKHVVELLSVLEKIKEEQVEIGVEDSQLVAKSGGVSFFSRVVDGQFPDYQTIIPKTSVAEVTLLKNDLTEALRKARVFAAQDQNVGLHVYPKKKVFTLTARSSSVGETSDSLDAKITGEDVDINFHIGYLSDCLSSIVTDSITLSFAGVGRPLIIRGVGDASFTYLVMPLNR